MFKKQRVEISSILPGYEFTKIVVSDARTMTSLTHTYMYI